MANDITKKTMVPLSLVGVLLVSMATMILWANAEHDSIKTEVCDTLRVERTKEVNELKADVSEVKEQVKAVDAKIDGIYMLLIKLDGGNGS